MGDSSQLRDKARLLGEISFAVGLRNTMTKSRPRPCLYLRRNQVSPRPSLSTRNCAESPWYPPSQSGFVTREFLCPCGFETSQCDLRPSPPRHRPLPPKKA